MDALLGPQRELIDQIDQQIVELIAQRMEAVHEIAACKREVETAPLRDNEREGRVHDAWSSRANELGLSEYYVGRVLREILRYSRRIQEGLLDRGENTQVERLTRVGIQGEAGSYSDMALGKLFATRKSGRFEREGFKNFSSVFDALESGRVDYALLPIENTVAGSLNEVYQLLAERAVVIVDEEPLPIEHCLLGLPGAQLERIHTVRSHPVALQQCQDFLGSLPSTTSESFYDTAAAAESLLAEQNPEAAAIASEECARRLGLKILKREIADQSLNITRFVLLARETEPVDSRMPTKISLLFTVNHRFGALAECLQIFSRHGLNLSKIESRSRAESPWEYLFYLDLEGHLEDSTVQSALDEVRTHTNHFKVLGCYPRRTEVDSARKSTQASAPKVAQAELPDVAIQPDHEPELSPTKVPAEPVAASPKVLSQICVGDVEIGQDQFVVMAGPCAVESRAQIDRGASIVKERGARVLRGGAFKPRSSPYSFQGLGFEGLDLLKEASLSYEIPIVTEVVRTEDVDRIAKKADALQVGARSMQNFALLKKLGTINRPILLKRGMSATISELLSAAEYIMSEGNQRVILCERGIRTFETATRSTLDVSAVPVLRERTHLPIIVDPSHAAGRRNLVIPLALAAAAVGADGLIVEVHPNPDEALCDKDQALTAADFSELMERLAPIVAQQGKSL